MNKKRREAVRTLLDKLYLKKSVAARVYHRSTASNRGVPEETAAVDTAVDKTLAVTAREMAEFCDELINAVLDAVLK